MPVYIDQLHREINISSTPQRIISLVPSITELLADLGLEDQVIGVTKFCEHPGHWRKTKEIIGGTKNLRFEKIESLQPDLIIANKEENNKADVEKLAALFPVWISDIKNMKDALNMIQKLGQVSNTEKQAEDLIQKINSAHLSLQKRLKNNVVKKVAYLIWKNPMMVAGGDTFINNMLECSGFENIFKAKMRYPEISADTLKAVAPDYILLSSEPYPFKEKDLLEFENICPTAVVQLIDGTYYSWYGSRLLPAMEYFHKFRASIALYE